MLDSLQGYFWFSFAKTPNCSLRFARMIHYWSQPIMIQLIQWSPALLSYSIGTIGNCFLSSHSFTGRTDSNEFIQMFKINFIQSAMIIINLYDIECIAKAITHKCTCTLKVLQIRIQFNLIWPNYNYQHTHTIYLR